MHIRSVCAGTGELPHGKFIVQLSPRHQRRELRTYLRGEMQGKTGRTTRRLTIPHIRIGGYDIASFCLTGGGRNIGFVVCKISRAECAVKWWVIAWLIMYYAVTHLHIGVIRDPVTVPDRRGRYLVIFVTVATLTVDPVDDTPGNMFAGYDRHGLSGASGS